MTQAESNRRPLETPVTLIDCDVHPYLKHEDELRDYMQEPWRSRTIPTRRQIYLPPGDGRRLDAFPQDGSPAGSDPKLVEQQVLAKASALIMSF